MRSKQNMPHKTNSITEKTAHNLFTYSTHFANPRRLGGLNLYKISIRKHKYEARNSFE